MSRSITSRMRVIAGSLKGLKLSPIGSGEPEHRLRPTSVRVRTSIFDILIHGQFADRVTGARVLDLFAGTGAMGIEALSRGAAFALFVDNGKTSSRIIQKNIDLAKVRLGAELRRQDATSLGFNPDDPFDLVFLDPPYRSGLAQRALRSVITGGWLADQAVVVAEEASEIRMPNLFETAFCRKFGSTVISFMRPV